jgi:trimeric autotransporter adhesin
MLVVVGALMGCGDAQLPYLTSIAVNPGAPSVAAGRMQQFTAMGTFSNGTTQNISSLVTWSSSTAIVGVIGPASGLAQTYSQGTSTITATTTSPISGTVTGTTTLTVTAPALLAVVVTDASAVIPGPISLKTATIAKGTSHQFLAFGVYSDGGQRLLTSPTWASSAATVATIAATGRATSVAAGTATITATDPTTSISGSSSLVVTNATLTGIEVYPVGQTNPAALGQTIAPLTRLPYAAQGVFSDGSQQDVTADATWASSNPAAATVSTVTPNGVATAVAAGSTLLTATLGSTTGSAPLIVSSASLQTITLTPAPQTGASAVGVAIGSTLQMNAVGKFSDGSTQSINLASAWSATGTFATVSATGLVTGVAAGASMVTAKIGTITASTNITVEALKSIAVSATALTINPGTLTIAQGTASQFIATATLADGTTQDVSASATWISTIPPAVTGTLPVITVSDALGSSGWVTGNTPGNDTVEAIFSGFAGIEAVTVTNATLKTLAITPTGTVHLALGASQQYAATGTFSDASTQILTNQVAWQTQLPTVAVMNQTGLATNIGTGTTNVVAVGNINGSTATSTVVLATP